MSMVRQLRGAVLQAKSQLPAAQQHADGIVDYLVETQPQRYSRMKRTPLKGAVQKILTKPLNPATPSRAPPSHATTPSIADLNSPLPSVAEGQSGVDTPLSSQATTPIRAKKRRIIPIGSMSDGELAQSSPHIPKESFSEGQSDPNEGIMHESDTSSDSIDMDNHKVEIVAVKDHNTMNSFLKNLYKGNQPTTPMSTTVTSNTLQQTTATTTTTTISPGNTVAPSDSTNDASVRANKDDGQSAKQQGKPSELDASKSMASKGRTPMRPKSKSHRSSSAPEGDEDGERVTSTPPPAIRLRDLGGMASSMQEIRELIEYPIRYPQVYTHLGATPPRGVLLHGPPGCGKTQLAHAIAGEMSEYGATFFKISAPEIVSGMSGESEKKLRSLFREAAASAPSIIFIDEIDAITPKRETAQREMERRIVAQMLTCMDDLTPEKTNNSVVLVLGATNRPDSLDPALRRAGRFDRELAIGIPDERGREAILQVLSSRMKLEGEFDFKMIARATPGYVGADLASLTKEASVIAVTRTFQLIEQQENEANQSDLPEDGKKKQVGVSDELLATLSVKMDDFTLALKKVQPSAKREGFATIPDVTWSDIGALGDIQQQLVMSIVMPIRHPDLFKSMGLTVPAGVLLYGPPGCGKTLLAKAVANQSGANFISIKGPELLNKFVGESERAVRQTFQRGRSSAPCVIFFDELDALCTKRGQGDSASQDRVLLQLLTEMDGLDDRKQVFVIAATNRPDLIDPAMLRPGRLDTLLYVPLPTVEGRVEILRASTRRMPLDPDVDISELATRCARFSGADLASLCREACMVALREVLSHIDHSQAHTYDFTSQQPATLIQTKHFESALRRVSPSVPERVERSYELMKKKIRCSNLASDGDEATQKNNPEAAPDVPKSEETPPHPPGDAMEDHPHSAQ